MQRPTRAHRRFIRFHMTQRAASGLEWLIEQSYARRRAPTDALAGGGVAQAEPLECRRLLAGIESGVLVARGTSGADTISIRRTGPDDVIVTTNGVNQTFDMDDFTGVRLEGLGGDDRFNLIDPLTSPVVRNTTVLGGAGSDTISYETRTAGLTFSGYVGVNDVPFIRVTSRTQSDWVGPDVETLIGGAGNDVFDVIDNRQFYEEPTPAAVRFEGRGGNDSLRFPTQGVTLRDATLLGGSGNDVIDYAQGSGGDLFGGAGNDVFRFGLLAGPVGRIDGGAGIDRVEIASSEVDESLTDLRTMTSVENGSTAGHILIGTDGPNHLVLSAFSDGGALWGGGGNDTLVGSEDADELYGEGGNDSLAGGLGNDTLDGGDGFDIADGGPGSNTYTSVELTPAAPRIRIFDRLLIAEGSWGRDLIEVERVGDDEVVVRVNNAIDSFNAADFDGIELRGNNGFDHLRIIDPSVPSRPFVRPVTLLGGNGYDTIDGSEGGDVILGGDGDDSVHGSGGDDSIVGAFGSDVLDGGDGTDTVDGGPGNDIIRDAEVTPPPPRIRIEGRMLIADGSWGVDLLTIEPVAGDDDVIVRVTDAVRRFDTDDFDGVLLRGQAGFDVVHVLQPIRGHRVTLHGNDGYDTLIGSAGPDVMYGGNGNDVLLAAQGGRDHLDGGWHDDFIDARDGDADDSVFGNAHVDRARVDPGDAVLGVERFA